MLMKLTWVVFLIILVVCQMTPVPDENDDIDYSVINTLLESLTSEELAEIINILSRQSNQELALDNVDHNTRYSYDHHVSKRDALWTTTEVLDCIRRFRHFKNSSKLDLVTEMLNCYRRMKHSG